MQSWESQITWWERRSHTNITISQRVRSSTRFLLGLCTQDSLTWSDLSCVPWNESPICWVWFANNLEKREVTRLVWTHIGLKGLHILLIVNSR